MVKKPAGNKKHKKIKKNNTSRDRFRCDLKCVWNNTNQGPFSGNFQKDEFRWDGTKWYYFKTY